MIPKLATTTSASLVRPLVRPVQHTPPHALPANPTITYKISLAFLAARLVCSAILAPSVSPVL